MAEITPAILIVSLYGISVLGVYSYLRGYFSAPESVAVGVPLCQAIVSFLFQVRFLSGIEFLHPFSVLIFAALSGTYVFRSRGRLCRDLSQLLGFASRYRFVSGVLLVCLVYSFAQVMLLLPRNHDALAYHLPRVFLFNQENTLTLDAFSMFHQAVFPVGADILFLPFVQLETLLGTGIFSLSSYVSCGAAVYALTRRHAGPLASLVSSLVVLSLPLIAMQGVTLKNDLLMAGAGAAALVIALKAAKSEGDVLKYILLLAVVAAYGISCKSTFIAFVPGLALLIILRWQLYKPAAIRRVFGECGRKLPLVVGALALVLVLSQVWLFAWNHSQYGSWSGPESLTYRHQQHDGIGGLAANVVRYAVQAVHAGPWTDRVLTYHMGIAPFSESVVQFFAEHLEPILGGKGATRENFEVAWLLHESLTWFGPIGAFLVFVFVPIALFRKPKFWLELLPSLIYFVLVCGLISWMPWNSRFFSICFVCICPAVGIALAGRPRMLAAVAAMAAVSLVSTKVFDFSRPLLSISEATYLSEDRSIQRVLKHAVTRVPNAWSRGPRLSELHDGNPSEVLDGIEPGARIGIFLVGHTKHYGFYQARPDLNWYPMNHLRGSPPLDLIDAWKIFLKSEIDYMLWVGVSSPDVKQFVVRTSHDGTATLLRHPANTGSALLRAASMTAPAGSSDGALAARSYLERGSPIFMSGSGAGDSPLRK